jgi:hypothetical protein
MTEGCLLKRIGLMLQLVPVQIDGCPNVTAEALSMFFRVRSMTYNVFLNLSIFKNIYDGGLSGIAKRRDKVLCLDTLIFWLSST